MKVYFNNSCKICRSEINLYKKENIKDIDWIDITNNSLAKKETSRDRESTLCTFEYFLLVRIAEYEFRAPRYASREESVRKTSPTIACARRYPAYRARRE